MSDLSWLNPTPHAIAVYASQPTSPLTTQHSLPSGRYSLLGPDFHRLDRTSFAWRTHSITSSARRRIERDTVAAAIVDHLRLCNGGWHAARRGVGSRIWDRAKAEWMRRGDIK